MYILSCRVEDCEAEHAGRGWCAKHYQRWYSKGSVADPVEYKTCRQCGVAVQRKGITGPHPKYCSQNCSANASYARRKDAICARKRDETAAKPLNRIVCIQCQGTFESKHRSPKFCSAICNNRWRDVHNPARCSEDGCDRGVRAKKLCNMHWRRKARADGREAIPTWTESRKANYHKRRAQKLSTQVEDIRPIDIYERDIWLCGLCSTPVDPDSQYPDPMSPSLDHITPLSKGGTHTYENVQLAHLACNVSKGDRVAA